MSPSELEKYDSCIIWLEGFRSKMTRKNYMLHLSLFLKFHNINPDILIAMSPQKLKEMILTYIIHLKKIAKTTAGKPVGGKICVNTIPIYITGIQSFLDFHEIPIAWKKLFKFLPETVPSNLRAYEKEEIRKILSVADLRDKCIILIMCSGGLRVGALSDLQVKHLSVLDTDSGIGLLKVYPNSRNDSYSTLLTPECMASIQSYLQWRREHGERINDDSPLIRDKFGVFSARKNMAKPLAVDTIYQTMARLLKKAGINSLHLQPDHSFRYFFNSCLINSDVNHGLKELIMGHSLKLDDFYYDSKSKPSRQKLLLEYMKALDALSIDPSFALRKQITIYEEKLKEVPKVEQLQDQLANRIIEEESIKQQVKKLQQEKEQAYTTSAKYEKDMQLMKEQMSQVMSMIQKNPKLAQVKPEVLTKKVR